MNTEPVFLSRSLLANPSGQIVIVPSHVQAIVHATISECATSLVVLTSGVNYEVDGAVGEVAWAIFGTSRR